MHESKAHDLKEHQHSPCQALQPLLAGWQVDAKTFPTPSNRTI